MKFSTKGLENYVTDEDREAITGVWVPVQEKKFLILRAGGYNKKYRRVLQALGKPYTHQIQRNNLPDEVARELSRKAYVQSCILDWKGVEDEDGNPVPFSQKACEELFEQLPEVATDVMALCDAIETFQQAEVTEAQDELGNSSSGSISTAPA